MKTIKIDKYFKGMVAHRGLSGIETENTIFSYLAAANRSYSGISCNLLISKDKQLILSAETSLQKYGLLNIDIQSFEYDELVKYNLVDRKTNNINRFLYIPLFTDYLSICKAYEKRAYIKIHHSLSNEILNQMLMEIGDYYKIEKCIFISENKKQAEFLIKSVQAKNVFYKHENSDAQDFEYSNKHKINVYLNKDSLDQDYIKKCHLIGLKVMAGVINDKEFAERAIKLDIDYIFTNILE